MNNAALNVLIADDERGDRKSIIRNCERAGLDYQFLETEDMPATERMLQNETVDCLLLDYKMPAEDRMPAIENLSGMARIRREHPYLPIIVITGHGDEGVARQAFNLGAADYLPKRQIEAAPLGEIIQRAIRQTQERQQAAVKQHDLELVTDILAHDLNMPIAHIGIYVHTLLSDVEKHHYSRLPRIAHQIEGISAHLMSILDILREAADSQGRLPAGHADLNLAMDIARKIVAERIDLSHARILVGPLPIVSGNLSLFAVALQNLLDNALKFNQSEQPKVEIYAEKNGDSWEIKVTDNGIGMPPETLQDIFTPFIRLHSRADYPGIGLGLSTVEHIVKRYGGRVRAQSQPQAGTTITLELPVQALPEAWATSQ